MPSTQLFAKNGASESLVVTAPRTSGQLKLPAMSKSPSGPAYATHSIRWFDCSGAEHRHKILLQNENGPCALIAIVNCLILNTELKQKWVKSSASKASGSYREYLRSHLEAVKPVVQLVNSATSDIPLSDLQARLGDALIALSNVTLQQSPDGPAARQMEVDVNSVAEILPKIHQGLNINPLFFAPTFAESPEISLFRFYNIDVVHAWLVDESSGKISKSKSVSEDLLEVLRQYKSYEELQAFLVEAETGSPEMQRKASVAKKFLADTATQQTAFGVSTLTQLLPPDSVAVFFANNHFSTLYSSQRPGSERTELYTLVTDAGVVATDHEITWQPLDNPTEFLTGEFGAARSGGAPQLGADNADYELAQKLQALEYQRNIRSATSSRRPSFDRASSRATPRTPRSVRSPHDEPHSVMVKSRRGSVEHLAERFAHPEKERTILVQETRWDPPTPSEARTPFSEKNIMVRSRRGSQSRDEEKYVRPTREYNVMVKEPRSSRKSEPKDKDKKEKCLVM